MSLAKPLTKEEYDALYAELYKNGKSVYSVDLDSDPTNNPRKLNEKIERVQAYKNRVSPILNRAISNESYWKNVLRKLELRLASAENAAMVSEPVRAEKNAESRKAAAKIAAEASVNARVFEGRGELVDHLCTAQERHADAVTFMLEVKNIYENLDSTDMNLARQQKNVLICAKLYGEAGAEIERPGQLSVGAPGM